MSEPVNILFADGISAAGRDVPEAMETFYSASQPFSVPEFFNAHGLRHGVCTWLTPQPGQSRAEAMLAELAKRLPELPKEETRLYLATTVGAIDLITTDDDAPDCTQALADAAKRITGLEDLTLVSAACASGQTAISMAMRALRSRRCKYALVLGVDIVSAFVTSGFSSLGAYSKTIARPYSADRDGLLLGEGCGALLLSLEDAKGAVGRLHVAHESCDASHITAPDLTGTSLARLIQRVLEDAPVPKEQIAGIIGHGTGTVFNDKSEIAALNQIFPSETTIPLISIKGNTGHTLGATGVLQTVYGMQFLRRGAMPPQAGLTTPAENAEHFLDASARLLATPYMLSLNVGFGGLNSALLMEVAL